MHDCQMRFTHLVNSSHVLVLLCIFTGCGGTGTDEPFDDERLRLLSVSAKRWPSLEKPAQDLSLDITEEQAEDLDRLVAALRPIKSVRIGVLPSEDVDYALSFQPGKNPVTIHVRLAGKHLTYAERQYVYEGGDAQEFQRIAEAIFGNVEAEEQ